MYVQCWISIRYCVIPFVTGYNRDLPVTGYNRDLPATGYNRYTSQAVHTTTNQISFFPSITSARSHR
uniref:Uncharacterized protein n=1 Tax=Arundo donax TaxID=35708 RepID=A0A0A8YGC1_ARUDO